MKKPLSCSLFLLCLPRVCSQNSQGNALKYKWDQIISLLKTQQSRPMDLKINSMVFTMVYEAPHDLALGYLFNFISYQFSLLPFPCSNHSGLFTAPRAYHIYLYYQDFSLTLPSIRNALKSDICMTQIWPFQRSLPWLPYQSRHFHF